VVHAEHPFFVESAHRGGVVSPVRCGDAGVAEAARFH
jgi:hypothetical protein